MVRIWRNTNAWCKEYTMMFYDTLERRFMILQEYSIHNFYNPPFIIRHSFSQWEWNFQFWPCPAETFMILHCTPENNSLIIILRLFGVWLRKQKILCIYIHSSIIKKRKRHIISTIFKAREFLTFFQKFW